MLGRLKQNKLKNTLVGLDTWIVFGHFSLGTYDDLAYDLKIVLLRDPLERAISHFHYVKQRLPDNKTTRRRHKEVSLIKDGYMTIEEFAELDHVKYFYSKYYLNKIILDERLIVLPVDNLEMSFTKIMEFSRIKLDPMVHVNKSKYFENFDHLRDKFSADAGLYNDLVSRSRKVHFGDMR